jgi:hypothetical protein
MVKPKPIPWGKRRPTWLQKKGLAEEDETYLDYFFVNHFDFDSL